MSFVGRWRGETWQALLTRDHNGYHFSVSAQGRLPTDEEVERARGTDTRLSGLVECTAAHQALGAINPFVRHFVPEKQAQRMFDRATTGRP